MDTERSAFDIPAISPNLVLLSPQKAHNSHHRTGNGEAVESKEHIWTYVQCCVRWLSDYRVAPEKAFYYYYKKKGGRVGKTGRKGKSVPHGCTVRLCFLSRLNTFKRMFLSGFMLVRLCVICA